MYIRGNFWAHVLFSDKLNFLNVARWGFHIEILFVLRCYRVRWLRFGWGWLQGCLPSMLVEQWLRLLYTGQLFPRQPGSDAYFLVPLFLILQVAQRRLNLVIVLLQNGFAFEGFILSRKLLDLLLQARFEVRRHHSSLWTLKGTKPTTHDITFRATNWISSFIWTLSSCWSLKKWRFLTRRLNPKRIRHLICIWLSYENFLPIGIRDALSVNVPT